MFHFLWRACSAAGFPDLYALPDLTSHSSKAAEFVYLLRGRRVTQLLESEDSQAIFIH